MRVAIFSAKNYDCQFLEAANVNHSHELFFLEDLSEQIIQDDVFERLLTFPNVIITGHQAFLTQEALQHIAETTLANITDFEQGCFLKNEVTQQQVVAKGVG